MKKIVFYTMFALALATSFTACKDADDDEECNLIEPSEDPTAVKSDFPPLVISIRVLSPEGYSILNAVNSQYITATFRGETFACDQYSRGYNAQFYGLKRNNDILLFGELNGAMTYENEQIILSWGGEVKPDTITFTNIYSKVYHYYVNGEEQLSSTWDVPNSSNSNSLTIYKELPTYEPYPYDGSVDEGVWLDNKTGTYTIRNMPLTMDEKDGINSSSLITMHLLNNLSKQGEYNTVFSPLSLFNACGILANGLSEDSNLEKSILARAMGNHWDNSLSNLNHVYKTVNEYLPLVDRRVHASAPSALFVHDGFTIYKGFVDLIADNYKSDYALLNFNDPSTVLQTTGWAAQKTQGTSNGVFNTDLSYSSKDIAFIISTATFYAYWNGIFYPEKTKLANFVNKHNSVGQVRMMYGRFHTRHWENNYFEYLELPLGNQAWEMTVLLPKERGNLQCILNNINVIFGSDNQAEMKDVEVYLPCIADAEDNKNLLDELKTVLQGFRSTFDPLGAHYGEISPHEGFHPTYIEQPNYFKIDETGCSTFISLQSISHRVKQSAPFTRANQSPSDVVTFRADSPFVYFIRERSSGVILIAGVYTGVYVLPTLYTD